ncbi:MAG: hypothetical protein LBH50_05185, partial [Spirochaetaceae bacterium]|nr:hypothetical protein [Spirochaetaceae bacterium]
MNIDTGTVAMIAIRLFFSALAAVFAVIIWSKTRDSAWMLIVLGVTSAYAENVYFVMKTLGITESFQLKIGSVPVAAIVIS